MHRKRYRLRWVVALLLLFSHSYAQIRYYKCDDVFSKLKVDACEGLKARIEKEYGMTPRDYIPLFTEDIGFEWYVEFYESARTLIYEELQKPERQQDDEWIMDLYYKIFPRDENLVYSEGKTRDDYLFLLRSGLLDLAQPNQLDPNDSLVCKMRKSVEKSKEGVRTKELTNQAAFITPLIDLGLNVLLEGFAHENRHGKEMHSIYRPKEDVFISEHSFGLDLKSVEKLLLKGEKKLQAWLDTSKHKYVENRYLLEAKDKIDIYSSIHTAMWQLAKQQAVRDLTALANVKDKITLVDVFYWTTVYFNAGEENGRKRLGELKWNVPKHYPCELAGQSYERLTTDARCHATWRTASYEYAYARLHGCVRPKEKLFKEYGDEEDALWP